MQFVAGHERDIGSGKRMKGRRREATGGTTMILAETPTRHTEERGQRPD